MNWIPNRYKGFRSECGNVYLGQTPKGFYRVYVRAGENFADQGVALPSATTAKEYAEEMMQ